MNTIKSEEIAGTLLEEVFQITKEDVELAKNDLAKEVVGASEKSIGLMNEFEQKIFALIIKKLHRVNGMTPATKEEKQEFKAFEEDTALLKSLIFSQIEKRLQLNGSNVGIRVDFQIIAKEEHDGDCLICPIRKFCPDVH